MVIKENRAQRKDQYLILNKTSSIRILNQQLSKISPMIKLKRERKEAKTGEKEDFD